MTEDLHRMVKQCVLYATDRKYLFPTLVSAMQARLHSSKAKTDVIIFCFDLDEATSRLFFPVFDAENITLTLVNSSLIENQTPMMARLFLHRLVSPRYTDYLYLDGDVHIQDSLEPLLDAEVPDGHFLAANDPMTFLLTDKTPQSRDLKGHLLSLGLNHEQSLRYFNSGVLRIKSNGWEEIGQKAWEYMRDTHAQGRFPDQDALRLRHGQTTTDVSCVELSRVHEKRTGRDGNLSAHPALHVQPQTMAGRLSTVDRGRVRALSTRP